MLPRFHWQDISTVGHYLGVFVIMTGLLMVIPMFVACVFAEQANFVAFLSGIGCCFVIGSALYWLRPYGIDRRRSLLLTGIVWIVVGVLGAIPLFLSHDFPSFLDALFDSVAALTTTGASVAYDIDHLGYSQITWRALLTLAGGQAVIIIAMYLGFFGEGEKSALAGSTRRQGERGSLVSETWRFIAKVGITFIVLGTVVAACFGVYLGLKPVDSVLEGFWLAANAFSTGGFVPHTSSVIYYHSAGLELVLMVFMLLGAMNYSIYAYVIRGRWREVLKNSELRTYAIWIGVLTACVTIALTRDQVFTTLEGLLGNGLFMVVSTATTGGMQTVYPQQFGETLTGNAVIILMLAALFGTCSHASGGGIKIIRVMQVLRWVGYSIMLRILPESAHVRVRYEHFGGQVLVANDAMRAMTIFILYLLAAALGAMGFIAHGYDALQSLFESVSYVSNGGARTGLTSPYMSADLKVMAMLLMWAGRLEFISLIAVLAGIVMSLTPGNMFGDKHERNLNKRKSENRGGTAWRRRKNQDKLKGMRAGLPGSRVGVTLLAFAVGVGLLTVPAAVAATGVAGGSDSSVLSAGQVQVEDVPELGTSQEFREVSINGMLSATSRLDGEDVQFSGEAIGSALRADDEHVWVNVKQDRAMIGVLMTNDQAAEITRFGSYRTTGDTVHIEGVYHLACEEHAGELEVHAAHVAIDSVGDDRESHASTKLTFIAVSLVALGIALFALRWVLQGRPRWRRFV